MHFTELFNNVTKKEWFFVFLITILIIVITSFPPIFVYFNQPSGRIYGGIHYQNSGDWNVYYSYIEQIKQGHFLLKNLFTSESQNRVFFNPVWIIAGLIARFFNLSSIVSFQILRIITIPVFSFVAYIFISYLFKETVKRKICFLLLLFSGGFGEYSQLADGFTFLTVNFSPHLIIALTLIILTFLFILLSWEKNSVKYSLMAGISSLVLFIIQPFVIPVVYLVPFIFLFIHILLRKENILSHIKNYMIFFLISLPAVIYYLYLINVDWTARMYQVQNTLLSPPISQYILAYGFLVILMIFGLKLIFNSKEKNSLFIFIWLVVNIVLLYGPFNFQKRMVEGLHVPIVIFSTWGLIYLQQLWRRTKIIKNLDWAFKSLLFWLCIILLPWSSILMVIKNTSIYPEAYLDKQEYEAIIWLKNNSMDGEIVLSDYYDGNHIAGLSARNIYLGHGIQTINWEKKQEQLKWFLEDNENLKNKQEFLEQNGINYLFFGQREKNLGNLNPDNLTNLKLIYNNDKVDIYKVISP
jgi:hypothetical protein